MTSRDGTNELASSGGPEQPGRSSSSNTQGENLIASNAKALPIQLAGRAFAVIHYVLKSILPDIIFTLVCNVSILFPKPVSKDFKPSRDLPSLNGKVLLITGGTAGLGRGSLLALLHHSPAEIVFSGRNTRSAEAVIAEARKAAPGIPVTFLQMDLASLESVQKAAHLFIKEHDRLDVLMNNAGVMATDKAVTKEGYEVQFGTNHLGHALLTKLLLPMLEATAQTHGDARIVNMTSVAYRQAPPKGIEFATLKTTQSGLGIPFAPVSVWYRYGQSKLANLLYPRALAKHCPAVTSVAVHPGVVGTGLFSGVSTIAKPVAYAIRFFGKTAEENEGFFNQIWAAAMPRDKLENGAYYEPVGVKTDPSTRQANDEALAERLWQWTRDELKGYE